MSAVPRPHPSRLDPTRRDYDEILLAHQRAIDEGEPFYRDPATGLMVLTRATHLARGTCCASGCRHCPYLDDSASDDAR
ncbi:MAG TPA: DUF5522 domain-containing protein [Acidimicrobiales bacterium]|nr:MAG: hypothetical protein B7X07_03155 [Actinobacteria bacterium 21-64-8]HQU00405.1 DUF5522 domain-containing protein [Acidimicrobiales bacterium]